MADDWVQIENLLQLDWSLEQFCDQPALGNQPFMNSLLILKVNFPRKNGLQVKETI